MQTLIFNTTTRTAKLYKSVHCATLSSDLLYEFENVPTVKFSDGFYEVIQEEKTLLMKYPVLRVPISNTNMRIEH